MNRDIIAIGGSAGSLDTLLSIAAAFPGDFKGNIFVAIHIGHARSQLPELLARVGQIAGPGTSRPRSHQTRSHLHSAQRSAYACRAEFGAGLARAARTFHPTGDRPVVPIGGDRVWRARGRGRAERRRQRRRRWSRCDQARRRSCRGIGPARCRSPPTCRRPPRRSFDPTISLPSDELPALLVRLSCETIPDTQATGSRRLPEPVQTLQRPLALTCPDCGGTLRKTGDGPAAQFRCHIGHVFSGGELSPAQIGLLEKALDTARRVLNERIELARQMADNSRTAGRQHISRHWDSVRAEAEEQVDAIRRVLPDQLDAQDAAAEIAH